MRCAHGGFRQQIKGLAENGVDFAVLPSAVR
jgi:hypothetical protein